MKFFSKKIISSMIGLLYFSKTNGNIYGSYQNDAQNLSSTSSVTALQLELNNFTSTLSDTGTSDMKLAIPPHNDPEDEIYSSETNANVCDSYPNYPQNFSLVNPANVSPSMLTKTIQTTYPKFSHQNTEDENCTVDGTLAETYMSPQNVKQQSKTEKSATKISKHYRILPTGDFSWYNMRDFNAIYVDKTSFLFEFIEQTGRLIFYTRPRRFGKTLHLQMMESFFRGEKNRFNDTFIFEFGNCKNGTWIEYPVVHLKFNDLGLYDSGDDDLKIPTVSNVRKTFRQMLIIIANRYNLDISLFTPLTLQSLISLLEIKFRLPVVVLIDEYDMILNEGTMKIKNEELIEDLVVFFNDVFSKIKSQSQSIKLAWITGVSRYDIGMKDLAGGPNSFEDYTYNDNYATAVGFTAEEIDSYFGEYINNFAKSLNKQPYEIMEEMRNWYDGYTFNVKNYNPEKTVYNPVSVINCLKEQKFSSYWSETGSVAYIVGKMYQHAYPLQKCIDYQTSQDDLITKYKPDSETIWIPLLMFHYGYLTIKKSSYIDSKVMYTLNFPNEDVKAYMYYQYERYVPSKNDFIENSKIGLELIQDEMMNSNANLTALVAELNRLGFPHFVHPLNTGIVEYDVTRRMAIVLNLAGIKTNHAQIISSTEQDPGKTNKGDVNIFTTDLAINYVIEINVGDREFAVEKLMNYINHNNALQKALNLTSSLYLTAINFSKNKNSQITDWAVIPYMQDVIQMDKMVSSSHDMEMIVKKKYDEFADPAAQNHVYSKLAEGTGNMERE